MTFTREYILNSEHETKRLAHTFAAILQKGDVIGLTGPVGAGKSTFARQVIQHALTRAGQPVEDVPSPTFTLIQTYQVGALEIWHGDLYRLTSPDEVLELGLDEAFEDALCLIEWPDRMAEDWPKQSALMMTFTPDPEDAERRALTLCGPANWQNRLHAALRDFTTP